MRNIHEKEIGESVEEMAEVLRELGRQHSLRDPIAFATEELTPPQVHTILWLGSDGAMTMGDIATRAGVTEKTMTGVVDRLERADYVNRERSEEDRRVVRVKLTRKGTGMYKRLDTSVREGLHQLLGLLDSSERRCLIDIMRKISNCLSAKTSALLKTTTKTS